MKCQVRWINAQGQPTPDDNDAVMMAHFHEPIWGTPVHSPNNRIQGYSHTVRESFPICAKHYAMVDASFRFPRGGWTFSPIHGMRPEWSHVSGRITCDHCRRTQAGEQSCCPFHYESDLERDRR
jgi:hypothetical protein